MPINGKSLKRPQQSGFCAWWHGVRCGCRRLLDRSSSAAQTEAGAQPAIANIMLRQHLCITCIAVLTCALRRRRSHVQAVCAVRCEGWEAVPPGAAAGRTCRRRRSWRGRDNRRAVTQHIAAIHQRRTIISSSRRRVPRRQIKILKSRPDCPIMTF